MHFPSFVVGSLFSGTSFVLINQQLSYRERLTYKWPLQEYVEEKFREQWKEFSTQMKGERQEIRQQLGVSDSFSRQSIRKKWSELMDDALNFFAKKD
jgi:hypothetical protein